MVLSISHEVLIETRDELAKVMEKLPSKSPALLGLRSIETNQKA